MSIQPLSPQLCSVFLEEPQEVANSHNCKGTLYKIAAVVAAAALIAIFTGAMALYLGMITDLPGWAMGIAILVALACTKGLDLWGAGNQQFRQGEIYQAYADKYAELKNTPNSTIKAKQFLVDQGLAASLGDQCYNAEQLGALSTKEITRPLLVLLPAIARYEVLDEQARALSDRIQENIAMANQNARDDHDELELNHRYTYLKLQDDLSFTRLNQAILLQKILDPITEIEFEETNQGLVLKTKETGTIWGYVKRKDPMFRSVDYIAGRSPVFFDTENWYHSTEYFVDFTNHPNDLRRAIFDPEGLEQQEA